MQNIGRTTGKQVLCPGAFFNITVHLLLLPMESFQACLLYLNYWKCASMSDSGLMQILDLLVTLTPMTPGKTAKQMSNAGTNMQF